MRECRVACDVWSPGSLSWVDPTAFSVREHSISETSEIPLSSWFLKNFIISPVRLILVIKPSHGSAGLYSLQITFISVVSFEFLPLFCEVGRTSVAISISQRIKWRLREGPGSANKQLSVAVCPSDTWVCLDGEVVHCGKSGLRFPYITSLEQNYVPQLCHHEAIRLALANEMWEEVMYVTLEQKAEDPACCSPCLFSFCHEIWQCSRERERSSLSLGPGVKITWNREVVDPSWT